MSSVRMCDNPNCGEVFSEMELGWSTSQQVQMGEDSNGRRTSISVNVDMCPDCSGNTQAVANKLAAARRERRAKRLALESGSGPVRDTGPDPEDSVPADYEGAEESESYSRMVGRPGYGV
jgi:hypothetical protein